MKEVLRKELQREARGKEARYNCRQVFLRYEVCRTHALCDLYNNLSLGNSQFLADLLFLASVIVIYRSLTLLLTSFLIQIVKGLAVFFHVNFQIIYWNRVYSLFCHRFIQHPWLTFLRLGRQQLSGKTVPDE